MSWGIYICRVFNFQHRYVSHNESSKLAILQWYKSHETTIWQLSSQCVSTWHLPHHIMCFSHGIYIYHDIPWILGMISLRQGAAYLLHCSSGFIHAYTGQILIHFCGYIIIQGQQTLYWLIYFAWHMITCLPCTDSSVITNYERIASWGGCQ